MTIPIRTKFLPLAFLLWIIYPIAIFSATTALSNGGLVDLSASPFETGAIVAALQKAYPQRIVETKLTNGEWALRIDNAWFDWANGRLLPADTVNPMRQYAAYPFYPYPKNNPDFRNLGREEALKIEQNLEKRLASVINRNPAFYDALWQANSQETAWANIERCQIFGTMVSVHREIVLQLKAIQEELYQIRQSDSALNKFLNRISSVETWNWRTIKGTETRSYHSYGVALDLILKGVPDRQMYWLWARTATPGWYLSALRDRLLPPESLIRVFESHGFVWGGKWRMFDSMHFEYRPEIMILNGITLQPIGK